MVLLAEQFGGRGRARYQRLLCCFPVLLLLGRWWAVWARAGTIRWHTCAAGLLAHESGGCLCCLAVSPPPVAVVATGASSGSQCDRTEPFCWSGLAAPGALFQPSLFGSLLVQGWDHPWGLLTATISCCYRSPRSVFPSNSSWRV